MRAAVAIESLKENPYFAERVKEIAEEVAYLPARPDHDRLRDLLGQYDLLIIGARERITGDMLRGDPVRTRIIGTLSVGTDHLDLPALEEAGIHVERCPTANVRSSSNRSANAIAWRVASSRPSRSWESSKVDRTAMVAVSTAAGS